MSPALLHAAWVTAVVAVCLALCTIHSRKPSSFSSRRRGSSSRPCASSSASRESINGSDGAAACATPAAKVSPTPSDAPNKASSGGTDDDGAGGGPVTVIDVGTHGPIAPVFLPPDPIPPRRSLSVKHTRFAERLARIRSMRRGSGEPATTAADDDVFVGLRRGGDAADGDRAVLWTKTIILGERCRVPSGNEDDAMVPWRKNYRPRQPRSVPVTRSNSFAGVGACKRADASY